MTIPRPDPTVSRPRRPGAAATGGDRGRIDPRLKNETERAYAEATEQISRHVALAAMIVDGAITVLRRESPRPDALIDAAVGIRDEALELARALVERPQRGPQVPCRQCAVPLYMWDYDEPLEAWRAVCFACEVRVLVSATGTLLSAAVDDESSATR